MPDQNGNITLFLHLPLLCRCWMTHRLLRSDSKHLEDV
jgi:hypothetical protein